MGGKLHGELEHVLSEEGHPRRAVGLLEVAAGGQGALRSNTPMLSSPRKPPSNTFLPNRSLRFTHQVKFSRSLLKADLRKSMSASPRRACSVRWRKRVAQAWTGGFTSLKFHS